jgi:hypothetical protein
MAITRGFAATAIFAGVALGLAPTAFAVSQMSGHYIETLTNPGNGLSATNDWYFTPCGDGCADGALKPGAQTRGRAKLVGGQWEMDLGNSYANCSDGGSVPNAVSIHYKWDPDTLEGTATGTFVVPACGNPTGASQTVNVQFRQAP